MGRGRNYREALVGAAAQNVYAFDHHWLEWADTGVLVLPAGKSGHLELGYLIGQGKRGYFLLPGEPERFDVMYNFGAGVAYTVDELIKELGNA